MKAIQIRETGGPEVLQLVDLPIPAPGPGQVLEDPYEHGPAPDGEHLLGGGEGEGSQPGAFAPDQDHCSHYFFTVVDDFGAEVGGVVVVEVELAASLLRLLTT